MKKPVQQHFHLTHDHFRNMTQSILVLNLELQEAHVESNIDVIHLHNIEQWKSSPL